LIIAELELALLLGSSRSGPFWNQTQWTRQLKSRR
jgi:hypothetical protein